MLVPSWSLPTVLLVLCSVAWADDGNTTLHGPPTSLGISEVGHLWIDRTELFPPLEVAVRGESILVFGSRDSLQTERDSVVFLDTHPTTVTIDSTLGVDGESRERYEPVFDDSLHTGFNVQLRGGVSCDAALDSVIQLLRSEPRVDQGSIERYERGFAYTLLDPPGFSYVHDWCVEFKPLTVPSASSILFREAEGLSRLLHADCLVIFIHPSFRLIVPGAESKKVLHALRTVARLGRASPLDDQQLLDGLLMLDNFSRFVEMSEKQDLPEQ